MAGDDEARLTRLGYREIAHRYGLTPIVNGADLVLLPGGDFKLTKDNDLQLGDRVQSALGRLVVRWRFNAPTLKTLFDIVNDAKRKRADAETARDAVVELMRKDRKAALEIWHSAGDDIGVHEFGPEACAGAIMVVLQNLLRREWSDLDESEGTWLNAGERIEGHGLGPIVEATANNFRHSDEWAKTYPPSSQQKKSIDVLDDVLRKHAAASPIPFHVRGNVCPEVLSAISDDSFEILMDRFFAYVRALAQI
jgi:hypothetical protein